MRDFIYRKFIHRLLQINDTPESIALGTAVGLFLAMTPTVGIQMILMIIVGTVIRANRLAGIIMVYISNPFTLIPIYWADYWIGAKLLGKELMAHSDFEDAFEGFILQLDSVGLWQASTGLAETLGWGIVMPMFLGGAVFGLVLGIPTYPLTLRMVRGHHRRKEHRKALLALREVRRREREDEEPHREELQHEEPGASEPDVAAPVGSRSSRPRSGTKEGNRNQKARNDACENPG